MTKAIEKYLLTRQVNIVNRMIWRSQTLSTSSLSEEPLHFYEATNIYTCPEGKTLKHEISRTLKGYVGHGYEANRKDCMICHVREQCLKKGSMRRTIFKVDAFTSEKR